MTSSPPIRVVITDDSAVIRQLLRRVLEPVEDIEIVGVAGNGRLAIEQVKLHEPDVLILDVEMPVLDGIGTLRELKTVAPTLPVIMFSSLTAHGASTTVDALSQGASDYLTKPSGSNLQVAMTRLREQLVPKLRALGKQPGQTVLPAAPPKVLSAIPPRPAKIQAATPVEIVAIGSSTGGPNALAELIEAIPGHFPAPIVITQHMPPLFTKILAERLDRHSQLKCKEAEGGEIPGPGELFIAPGDYHLEVTTSRRIRLTQDAPENSCRPAVDVMFRSVAAAYGPGVLAVVLTGMGQDGMLGAKEIRGRGGQIFAQDQETSVVWGMPGAVSRNGLADRILPLDSIAAAVIGATEHRQKKLA